MANKKTTGLESVQASFGGTEEGAMAARARLRKEAAARRRKAAAKKKK